MIEILSLLLKYLFIIMIYAFIFRIVHLIYLDIRLMGKEESEGGFFPILMVTASNADDAELEDSYPLNRAIITLGRGKNNNINIKDPFISARHARFVRKQEGYFLEDMNSSNGVFVNNKKIEAPYRMRDGDRVAIGQVEFRFMEGGR